MHPASFLGLALERCGFCSVTRVTRTHPDASPLFHKSLAPKRIDLLPLQIEQRDTGRGREVPLLTVQAHVLPCSVTMVSSSPFCSSVAGLVFGEKEREREEDEEEKEMKEPDGRIMERCMPPMLIHTCNMKGACPQCQLLIRAT